VIVKRMRYEREYDVHFTTEWVNQVGNPGTQDEKLLCLYDYTDNTPVFHQAIPTPSDIPKFLLILPVLGVVSAFFLQKEDQKPWAEMKSKTLEILKNIKIDNFKTHHLLSEEQIRVTLTYYSVDIYMEILSRRLGIETAPDWYALLEHFPHQQNIGVEELKNHIQTPQFKSMVEQKKKELQEYNPNVQRDYANTIKRSFYPRMEDNWYSKDAETNYDKSLIEKAGKEKIRLEKREQERTSYESIKRNLNITFIDAWGIFERETYEKIHQALPQSLENWETEMENTSKSKTQRDMMRYLIAGAILGYGSWGIHEIVRNNENRRIFKVLETGNSAYLTEEQFDKLQKYYLDHQNKYLPECPIKSRH
jgi:hypothetical protein